MIKTRGSMCLCVCATYMKPLSPGGNKNKHESHCYRMSILHMTISYVEHYYYMLLQGLVSLNHVFYLPFKIFFYDFSIDFAARNIDNWCDMRLGIYIFIFLQSNTSHNYQLTFVLYIQYAGLIISVMNNSNN